LPRALLTQKFVRHAACPMGVRKVEFFDTTVVGFMLEVRDTGGKTYYQRYRSRHGRERQYKIGLANILTVAQARRLGRKIAAEAIMGTDPQSSREELRSIPSLSEFVRDSYLPFAKSTKRSWQTDETIFRVHILPHIGGLPMDEISGPAIAKILHAMRQKGYASGTTNRVLILLRYIFNLARKWQVPRLNANPTDGLKTEPEVHRERFLTHDETQRLLAALSVDINQTVAKAILLLLLTGARRNEITHAKWEYLDWRNRTLLVPKSKTGRPRLIALNSAAIELLSRHSRDSNSEYIFPSPVNGRPPASLHFPWQRIRARAQLCDVRLHDLRHSFASLLVNNGVSLYVVQNLLGHNNAKATQRYAHLANNTLTQAVEIAASVIERPNAAIPLFGSSL